METLLTDWLLLLESQLRAKQGREEIRERERESERERNG